MTHLVPLTPPPHREGVDLKPRPRQILSSTSLPRPRGPSAQQSSRSRLPGGRQRLVLSLARCKAFALCWSPPIARSSVSGELAAEMDGTITELNATINAITTTALERGSWDSAVVLLSDMRCDPSVHGDQDVMGRKKSFTFYPSRITGTEEWEREEKG